MSLASTRKTYGYGWARKITKWAAFKAGLPIAVTEIWKTLIEVGHILTGFAMLVALWAAGSGLFWGYWLTSPPHGIPMWWVWTTRASALVMIVYGVWVIARDIINVGHAKLLADADRATGPEDSTGEHP
ncbi:MAG: hypothetical protein M0Z68_05160 [Gammaproteobacteria bacterium]|jgi:hypothetical protein|nr:hypothetical protein [Gammaproteobacteria bacterium]